MTERSLAVVSSSRVFSAIVLPLRPSIIQVLLAYSVVACGSAEVVSIIPSPDVDLIAVFSLHDPSRPLELANLGAGSGLRDLSTPISASPHSLVLGFSSADLEHLQPPGAEMLAEIPLRPLRSDESRDSLPSPRWLMQLDETGPLETLEPGSFRIRLSSDWIREGMWKEVLTEPRTPALHQHTMAYDESRRAVIMVGAVGPVTESWQYDGVGWNSLGPVGTGARVGAGLAYDSARARLVLFGGRTSTSALSAETWELGPEGWAQKAPARSPPARLDHAMAFDPNRGEIVLFGGANESGDRLADTWTYDGEIWTRIFDPTPAARENQEIVYDEARGVILMFGGAGTPQQDETWVLEPAGWRALEFEHRPPGRSKFGMVYDRVRRKTLLFGGWRGPAEYADLWELDAYGWREVPVFGPRPRCNHAMAYDASRAKTVLNGGCDPSAVDCGMLDETWEYGVLSAPD